MENIKTQSTVLPEEHISLEQWMKQFRVGILHNTSKLTDKATQMMSLWDDQTTMRYYKKLKVG